MKKHKVLKITLLAIGVLIVALLIAAWCMFGTKLKAAMTVEKLEDGLYSMEYDGDYGFDAFLEKGGAKSDAEMADYIASFLSGGFIKPDNSKLKIGDFGCSTLAVSSPEGAVLFGRNYDWEDCDAMIVHTKPTKGYASVSTCCLGFLGFGNGWKPEGTVNKFLSLAAVYVPLDGMNEKGLCVADLLAGDNSGTHQDTEKADITTASAIRLLLDHAATVDEAIELLKQYDMNSSINYAHHFAVTDATGKSVVIEYISNEMIVTDTDVVTNFYISPGRKYGLGSKQSHDRFDTLEKLNKDSKGIMTQSQVQDALKSVAQSNFSDSDKKTEWSLVYDTGALTAQFYRDERFDKPYSLTLKDPKGWIK